MAGATAPQSKNPPSWERGSGRVVSCGIAGEFEQGRPVMEAFRAYYPDHKILLTFFSPSGYTVRKNYAGADFIVYLPADTPANARQFVATVKPVMAFFIKYEFWHFTSMS